MKNKYVVMDFEPSQGMTLYGVFDTHDEAVEWAEKYATRALSWFVVNINDHEEAAELIKELRGE